MDFTVQKVLRRVLRRGSEKGVSRRCLERPLVEYAPLGVRPNLVCRNTTTGKTSRIILGHRAPIAYVRKPPFWEGGIWGCGRGCAKISEDEAIDAPLCESPGNNRAMSASMRHEQSHCLLACCLLCTQAPLALTHAFSDSRPILSWLNALHTLLWL